VLGVSELEKSLASLIDARRERDIVPGPDFICIGMPKAGTGWLYDQLQHHSDFWMPPVKEVNYLLAGDRTMKNTIRHLGRSRKKAERGGQLDGRDRSFLEEAAVSASEPRSFERYVSLFRHKGELLSGDVSPKYCSLQANDIVEIGRHLPRTKILLLIRDPIARLWSGLSMLNRKGKLDLAVLENETTFRSFLARKGAEERMFPTAVLGRWRQHAPALEFRFFFLDDIESRPDEVRRDLLSFIGADPDKESSQLSASHNRKSAAQKLPMPPSARAVLVEHFAAELRACGAQLGGAAEAWPARYGL
jgi:Sulfotransferase family